MNLSTSPRPASIAAFGRQLSTLAIACFAVLAASCSSTPKAPSVVGFEGGAISYTTREGATLTLISDALLKESNVPGATPDERRVNFYSGKRVDAMMKVAPDDAVVGLIQAYEELGLREASMNGAANRRDRSTLTLMNGDEVYSLVSPEGADADPDLKTAFNDYVQAFGAVFNHVMGYQNVGGQKVDFEKRPEFGRKLRAVLDGTFNLEEELR